MNQCKHWAYKKNKIKLKTQKYLKNHVHPYPNDFVNKQKYL